MEMEKHVSGKQMFAEPAETTGHRVDCSLSFPTTPGLIPCGNLW